MLLMLFLIESMPPLRRVRLPWTWDTAIWTVCCPILAAFCSDCSTAMLWVAELALAVACLMMFNRLAMALAAFNCLSKVAEALTFIGSNVVAVGTERNDLLDGNLVQVGIPGIRVSTSGQVI